MFFSVTLYHLVWQMAMTRGETVNSVSMAMSPWDVFAPSNDISFDYHIIYGVMFFPLTL